MSRRDRWLPAPAWFASIWALVATLGIAAMAGADPAADRSAIEAAAQAWTKAFNSRDADALLALSTEAVVLMDPTLPPVTGGAAAQAWRRALGAAQGQVTTATKEIVIAGDFAWRIGAFTHKLPGNTLSHGQSLEIWQRVNGAWKIHRQMSSSLLAQPKVLPPPSEPVLDGPAH